LELTGIPLDGPCLFPATIDEPYGTLITNSTRVATWKVWGRYGPISGTDFRLTVLTQ
jgi:hypothetical protein